jgi:hypothetical protein
MAALLGVSTLLAACGGSDGSATPATAPASGDTIAVTDTVVVDTVVSDTSPSAPELPAGDSFEVCPTIPSLDVINTVLDEPATRAVELERGPATAICEAGSDGGIANVQFTRALFADRELTEQIAAELGATVTDLNDPELPGAFTYSAVALMIIDEVEYSVQVITFDTITNPDSPEATQRSATLLKAWLTNLGIG